MAHGARIEIPPAYRLEVERRLETGESLDTIFTYLKGQGWPGGRATLAARLAEMRRRPEEQVQDQAQVMARQGPGTEEEAAEGAPPAPAQEEGKPEGDDLAELEEARQLLKAIAKRAVSALANGTGSESVALKAVDHYAALTLKIRRLKKEEAGKQEKRYRIVELRIPAKEEGR